VDHSVKQIRGDPKMSIWTQGRKKHRDRCTTPAPFGTDRPLSLYGLP
jgi:hypothetical protein